MGNPSPTIDEAVQIHRSIAQFCSKLLRPVEWVSCLNITQHPTLVAVSSVEFIKKAAKPTFPEILSHRISPIGSQAFCFEVIGGTIRGIGFNFNINPRPSDRFTTWNGEYNLVTKVISFRPLRTHGASKDSFRFLNDALCDPILVGH